MGRVSKIDWKVVDPLLATQKIGKVSKITGIPIGTLRSRKYRREPKNLIDWTEADAAIRAGKNDYEVAEMFGLGRATVRYHRVALKIPANGRPERKDNGQYAKGHKVVNPSHPKYDWPPIEVQMRAGVRNCDLDTAGQPIPNRTLNHRRRTITPRSIPAPDIRPRDEFRPTRLQITPAEIIERKRKAMGLQHKEFEAWMQNQGPMSAFSQWRREVRL